MIMMINQRHLYTQQYALWVGKKTQKTHGVVGGSGIRGYL